MLSRDVSFPLAKAIEFVGENSAYQKRRLVWISVALVSISALNSFLPLTLTATQTMFFFFASAAGQLICPLYFEIQTTTRSIIFFSLVAAISVNRVPFLESLTFIGLGFFGRGLNISSFIYINEIGGEKWRAWCFMVMFMVWGSAPFTLALTKMIKVPDWLWMVLFVTLPHVIVYVKMLKSWQNSPYFYCEVKGIDLAKSRRFQCCSWGSQYNGPIEPET